MSEQDSRNETPNRRENEEEIVGQPLNQKDDMLDDDQGDVEDIEAEEGE